MGRVERYPHGTFCWAELGTADLKAAKAFYEALLGWRIERVETADEGTYLVGRIDGRAVAGMHAHAEGDVHNWDSYVAVDDLDSVTARARELGGEVRYGPQTIPGSARSSVIVDGGGARVVLWEAAGFPGAGLVNETGTWTWSDLLTRDPDAGSAFYEGLFGWRTERAVDIYASFTMGGLLIGGMRTIAEEETTPPMWMPYFVVADADAAATQVASLGGSVVVPLTAVPAGRFLIAGDPVGAALGLIEMGPEGPARGVDRLNPTSGVEFK